MKYLSVLALVVLMGAGCASTATTETTTPAKVTPTTTATIDTNNLTWKAYTDSKTSWDITFNYPTNYTVTSDDQGYNIVDSSGKTKIKIALSTKVTDYEVFRKALPNSDLGAAETASSVTVSANSFYSPTGAVKVRAFSSRPSGTMTIYLLDEQPGSDSVIIDGVLASLEVVAK